MALRSCWAEPLSADRVARLSRFQQQGRRRLHESGPTADEAVSHPAEVVKQRLLQLAGRYARPRLTSLAQNPASASSEA